MHYTMRMEVFKPTQDLPSIRSDHAFTQCTEFTYDLRICMYICMYVYICVCVSMYAYDRTTLSLNAPNLLMTCVYVCIHVCMLSIYVYDGTTLSPNAPNVFITCAYLCMYACMYICMYMCVCLCRHMIGPRFHSMPRIYL